MGSLGDELSLGPRRHSSVPKKASKIMHVALDKLKEHVKKLEDEKRKIQSSELELPLCLQILNDVILYLKEETEMDTQPMLKDFISLCKPLRQKHDEEREVQLWRKNDHISNGRFSDKKIKNTLEIERNEEISSSGLSMLESGLGLGLTSSSMDNERRRKGIASCGFASNSVPQPPPYLQQQALRKQRRCWTPELHRRFVDALQHLGGPGGNKRQPIFLFGYLTQNVFFLSLCLFEVTVATPKQIREHMQEEGLTNDEVKSHLQKYRLHIRKSDSNPEKQSVVVLGFKLWNSSQEESCEGGESSKRRSNSQSDSPQGPLQLPCTTTTTCGDSSMEDAEDAKSGSFQMERLRSP